MMSERNVAYIVENDFITATIAAAVLRQHLPQYRVQHWTNGQVAFDQLAATAADEAGIPAFILLDLDMPVMDGWEFLDALAGLPLARPTCVFILTSSIHPGDRERATPYGVVKGFLSKPLDERSVARMQAALELAEAAPGPGSARQPGSTSPTTPLGHP